MGKGVPMNTIAVKNLVNECILEINHLLSGRTLTKTEMRSRLEDLYQDPDLFFHVDYKLYEITRKYLSATKDKGNFVSLLFTSIFGFSESKHFFKELEGVKEESIYDFQERIKKIGLIPKSEMAINWMDVVNNNVSYEPNLLKKHFIYHLLTFLKKGGSPIQPTELSPYLN